MKFEDMIKIWDAQNQQAMFGIDENALHDRVKSQKAKAIRMTEIMEIILISVNFIVSLFLIILSYITDNHEYPTYLMAAIMMGTAAYITNRRFKRKAIENKYGGSIIGDLDDAIAVSTYKADLSSKMLTWYMSGIIFTSILSLLQAQSKWWVYLLVILFFGVTIIVGRWEHNSIHLARKKKLISIKKQFTEEWDLQ
jgi:hypothetical protein